MRLLLPLALGCVLAASLSACGNGSTGAASTTPGTIPVVAGENFWGNITSQIGGSHVRVTSIVTDPNTDPHNYESDPHDAAAVSTARLVVENGLGYDDSLAKLLGTSNNKNRSVLDVATTVHATGNDANPHLWYSPTYVATTAHAIADQLATIDPAHAADYRAGATTFLADYQPYVDTIATLKSRYAGTKIAYTERVPGYLLDAAGLTLGIPASFAQAVEDDHDPSPADTAAFDTALSTHTVKALLYNGQVTDQTTTDVKTLAAKNHVPVIPVTETIPAGATDFQTWQLDQAKALLTALGG